MPRSDAMPTTTATGERLVYAPLARAFHWTVAPLVFITVPIGFIMVDREDVKIADDTARAAFEATTNLMFSWHKVIGITILALMIARLTYRLMHGAPGSEPTLESWQKGLSHAVHWTLYLLLIVVPIGGYLGIAYYPALDVFGIHLPGFGIQGDEKFAEKVFDAHKLGAKVLLGLVGLHLAAVVFHRFVRGDGVLARMWPGSGERD